MKGARAFAAVRGAAAELRGIGCRFALVGGLAVSVRGHARFTEDVDFAVVVEDDAAFEALAFQLRGLGYQMRGVVEQVKAARLATLRLTTPKGIALDLLGASCGIETEIVERAELIETGRFGALPVACVAELLAMKVLSMSEKRGQDRIDAVSLVQVTEDLDLARLRANLALIAERGFSRGQDLMAKLEAVLAAVRDE